MTSGSRPQTPSTIPNPGYGSPAQIGDDEKSRSVFGVVRNEFGRSRRELGRIFFVTKTRLSRLNHESRHEIPRQIKCFWR
jgi:hypothetical protein